MSKCEINKTSTPSSTEVQETLYEPAFDVFETENDYRLEFDMPGVGEDSLDVNLERGLMRVSGQVQRANHGSVLLQEVGVGNYSRTLRLPKNADLDHVDANYENGVLTITLPKAESARSRKIPIRIDN